MSACVLRDEKLRSWVASFLLTAPLGCVITVEPARHSKAQKARLHALISEAVAGGIATDDGSHWRKRRSRFVSGWMIEEGHGSDIVYFGGRPVQLRRSTKTLSKDEFSRLVEFILCRMCPARHPTAGRAMMWRLLGFHDFEHFALWCPGCFRIIVEIIATAVTMGAAWWLFG